MIWSCACLLSVVRVDVSWGCPKQESNVQMGFYWWQLLCFVFLSALRRLQFLISEILINNFWLLSYFYSDVKNPSRRVLEKTLRKLLGMFTVWFLPLFTKSQKNPFKLVDWEILLLSQIHNLLWPFSKQETFSYS